MVSKERREESDDAASLDERIDPQVILADERYEIIGRILCEVYEPGKGKWHVSDLLDRVLLHRYLGIPIFLVIMWAMFHFTFEASRVPMAIIDVAFSAIGEYTSQIPIPWLASLLTNGLVGGVGFILTFLPPILLMYFVISILEDSGYLARAAFVMDRIMVKIGLHGRSFIPLLLGFGCSVPAIMASRTVDGHSNRLTTILVSPLMSCAARLPVYVLIAGIFFPAFEGTMIFLMYVLGIVMAVVMALIFKKTILREESSPLLMELPMYQMPTIHGSFRHTWDRGVLFLKRAGTFLMFGAIIVWLISSFGPAGYGVAVEESYVGILGKFLEPVFAPLGFSWQIVSAIIFGLLAKEVVVQSIGIILAVQGEDAIGVALISIISPVSALALMVFILLYTPCIGAIGTIRSETGSIKWTAFSVVYQLILAYLVALAVVAVAGLFIA